MDRVELKFEGSNMICEVKSGSAIIENSRCDNLNQFEMTQMGSNELDFIKSNWAVVVSPAHGQIWTA
jgi:hypothetical protein